MIKNLVIAGGGVKIIPVLGVLQYLEENDLLKNITGYYGASAGTIFCLLLLLNYSVSDIRKLILDFDMNKLFEPNIDIDNFLTNYHVYDQKKLEKVLKLLINYKLGYDIETKIISNKYENITLKEIYEKTGKKFTCSVTSLKWRVVKYFDYVSQPDLPIYKIILMSCAIPFIFKPVKWQGDLFIDGGLLDNFPMFIIPVSEIKMTLGIRPLIYLKKQKAKFDNIYDFITSILSIVTCSTNETYSYNVIRVKIDGKYSGQFVELNMTRDEKNEMINESYNSTKKQYKNLNIVKYKNSSTQTDILSNSKLKRSNSF